jgi:superfamily II DNA or RNA helicase
MPTRTAPPAAPALRPGAASSDRTPGQRDKETVYDAACLAGWERGPQPLALLLEALNWAREDGRRFQPADVSMAFARLAGEGRLAPHGQRSGAVPLAGQLERLGVLLREPALAPAWSLWAWATCGGTGRPSDRWRNVHLRDAAEQTSLLRLMLASGMNATEFRSHIDTLLFAGVSPPAMAEAMRQLLACGLADRVDSGLWWQLLDQLDAGGALAGAAELSAWIGTELAQGGGARATGLRLRLAEAQIHRGDLDGALSALGPDADLQDFAPLLRAAHLAWQGRFEEARAAFAPALKQLAERLGRRKALAPPGLLQWHLLSLMHEDAGSAWLAARRFCISESGTRSPPSTTPWGRWAHACGVKLGAAVYEPMAFDLPKKSVQRGLVRQGDLPDKTEPLAERVVLSAWLGEAPKGWEPATLQEVSDGLFALGKPWKADLLIQACLRLGWLPPQRPADAPPPWPVAWFGAVAEPWEQALATIAALGGGTAEAPSARPAATLRWRLALDAHSRPFWLQAFEPSASGRAKAKALSVRQLQKRERLDPRDLAAARAVRRPRFRAHEIDFDLCAAVGALVGHPGFELADEPDVAVELTEGLPVLHVLRQPAGQAPGAEEFVFRLQDELLADDPPELVHHEPEYDEEEAEEQRRDSLRIVRDSAQRARLIRITPAQRRVAELAQRRWAVPVRAQAELEAALRVLAGHFELHSDIAGGETVPADARLVARLEPRGDALELQLLVRPFGGYGPVLAPGSGRERLHTVHGGTSLATARDLAAERGHLAAVLAALPFLGDEMPPDARWSIDDGEQALAAVQTFGAWAETETTPDAPDAAQVPHAPAEPSASLAPVRLLEWPKGQRLKVIDAEGAAFSGTLASGRGWFELQGELRLDEDRVLSLQQLLGLLQESQGRRYIALGQGRWLALADRLRQRLAELAVLADSERGDVRIGDAAALWLNDAAPDLGLKGDAAWRERAARLERAAESRPEPPAALQAALRTYQIDGYAWMQRLAEAGFGACLADDMGLGKTVQTLAVLLARAERGPALVVAPTSVCDNWVAEAQRFAPGLQARVYGRETPREGVQRSDAAAGAAAGDVLIVSYALLLRDAEALAARDWATLVLDEAQALKNAATQRARAVETIRAEFRLALTGTPVENRLGDLWSLMNLLNPGLLGSASRFNERFAGPIERQRNDAARARLRRLVSPFLLRRNKAQVLTELPPRTEIVLTVEPDADEQAFLEALRRSAQERIARLDPTDGRNAFNVLAELTRLRRAACDPRLVAPELGRSGAKVQTFQRLATELVEAGHQVLVFSQFTDFLDLLAEQLAAAGLSHLALDGRTPAALRSQRVAAFQRGESALFLISLKAGGFGLNLTAADYVIIADPWWNPAAEDQAMGRAHRMGQQRPVTVYRLVTRGSVEERIVALHSDKRALAESLIEGQDGGTPLGAAELLDLLRG